LLQDESLDDQEYEPNTVSPLNYRNIVVWIYLLLTGRLETTHRSRYRNKPLFIRRVFSHAIYAPSNILEAINWHGNDLHSGSPAYPCQDRFSAPFGSGHEKTDKDQPFCGQYMDNRKEIS
jgi:hypothetical protein